MNAALLLLPDFSLIVCGYLVCRFTALDRSIWQPLESVVYFFLFPVLLFHSIVRSPLDLAGASELVAAGVLLGVLGIGLSYSLPHWPVLGAMMDRRDHAASAQIAFRFNSFIALALAQRLAGAQGQVLIAVLIGVCVPLFNIAAVWPMARLGQAPLLAALLRNPLIVATTCGLAANVAGLRLPPLVDSLLGRIGGAAIVLGLLGTGAGMHFGSLARAKALAVAVLTIRHAVLPVAAWGLARIFALPPLQATVLLIFSALPTASSAYVLASRMGYNGPLVAGLVTLSTLLGVGSLALVLG